MLNSPVEILFFTGTILGAAYVRGYGGISGLFNGSAAIGGPPVILFFFSSPTHAHVSRASLIAFFLGSDMIASGVFRRRVLLFLILLSGMLLAKSIWETILK